MIPQSAFTEPFVKGKYRGKDVLYSENRIVSSSVPVGYYRYEIRHKDENWKKPSEIADIVVVNFWGTMITNEPLQMDASGCIMLKKKDISYNGAVQSLTDYMLSHHSNPKTVYKITPLQTELQDLVYSFSEHDHKYGCVGHLRGYFEKDTVVNSSWFDHISELNSAKFRSELDHVINWLREENNPLHSLSDMEHFCKVYGSHAVMQTSDRKFAFAVDGEQHQYLFRMLPYRGDYNFYVYCYDKNAAEIKLDLNPKREKEERTI